MRFTFHVRRVERSEWLRVLPNVVFLPVLAQILAISSGRLMGVYLRVNGNFQEMGRLRGLRGLRGSRGSRGGGRKQIF